jgi:hypothetical protein
MPEPYINRKNNPPKPTCRSFRQQCPDRESDLKAIQELAITDVKAVYEEAVPLNLNGMGRSLGIEESDIGTVVFFG